MERERPRLSPPLPPFSPRGRAAAAGGFTVIELLFVAFVLVVLVGILLPAMPPRHRPHRQLKDQIQLRSIMQSLVLFAESNHGEYPLPSKLDPDNHTVAGSDAAPGGEHKDVTAHIFSKLIYDGYFPTELAVSPSEVNVNIVEDADYQFTSPSAAVDPALALWDPAFAADFASGKSNFSYAHTLPRGPRAALWYNTFSATEATVGTRGPRITGLDADRKPIVADPNTNTFKMHGVRNQWAGLVGFNDNHVSFYTDMAPDNITYTTTSGAEHRDTLFYDEPDDANGTNAFLAVYTTAGPEAADFTTIWD